MSDLTLLKTVSLYVKRENIYILENVNFNVGKGEISFIIGESGSGKSTFLKTLNSLIPIASGSIIFKDKDITDYSPIWIRKKICYIPQVPVPISETVFKEFQMIRSDIKREYVKYIFDKFKLQLSILDKSMKNLSVGQQQRVSIIRGILNSPEIMLLDEPTSALDKENINLLEEIVLNLKRESNMSFVIVTHNLEMSEKLSEKTFLLKKKTLELIQNQS